MNVFARPVFLSVIAAVATVATQAADAADFPQTTAAYASSIDHGFSKRTLITQRRYGSLPAPNIAAALQRSICASDCARTPALSADGMRSSGRDWRLDVVADGTSARYDNLAAERRVMPLARDPSQELSATALEKLGRSIIATTLRPAIVLAAGEELVPLHTDYMIGGAQSLRTHKIDRYVLANRIVFGRKIAGVPIVGGASRVVLTFTNDGALESFRYDWPRYRASGTVAAAPVSQIVERVRDVVGARFHDRRTPMTAPKRTASVDARTRATSGKSGTAQLQKLECGYYDPGNATYGVGATIQPGCVYHVVRRDADGFREGYAGAVPGATAFTRDAAWPESVSLRPRR